MDNFGPNDSADDPNKEEDKAYFQYVDEHGKTFTFEAPVSQLYVDEQGNTVIRDDFLKNLVVTSDQDGVEHMEYVPGLDVVSMEEIVEEVDVASNHNIHGEGSSGDVDVSQGVPSTWRMPIADDPNIGVVTRSTRRSSYIKENYGHNTVLMSSKSLRAKPQFVAKSGQPSEAPEEEHDELPSERSLLNRTIPGMKNILRVVSKSMLLRAEVSLKQSTSESVQYDDENSTEVAEQPAPSTSTEGDTMVQVVKAEVAGSTETRQTPISEIKREEASTETTKEQENAPEDEMDTTVTEQPMENAKTMRRKKQTRTSYGEWPLYWDKAIDFQEACEILVGIHDVASEKVCSTVPTKCIEEGTFVVDLRQSESKSSIGCDQNGKWSKPSGKVRYYKENSEGKLVRADNGKGQLLAWTRDYTYKIMLKRYENTATLSLPDKGKFEKKIYTAQLSPEKNSAVALAIVTYEWRGGEAFDFHSRSLKTEEGSSENADRAEPHSLERQAPKNAEDDEGVVKRKRRTFMPPPINSKNWEMASFSNAGWTIMPETMSAFYEGFPLYAHGAIDFSQAASIILGGTIVDKNKICNTVPQGYRYNGSFIIDTKRLATNVLELRRDDNGLWRKPSGGSRFYKFDEDSGDAVRVDRNGRAPTGVDYDIQVLMKRYENMQVANRFVRKIYTAKGQHGKEVSECHQLAVITYFWKGEPEVFEPETKQNQCLQNKRLDDLKEGAADEEEYVAAEEGDDVDMAVDAGTGATMLIQRPRTVIAQRKRRRFDIEETAEELIEIPTPMNTMNAMVDMRLNVLKKDLENQNRMSTILDRAEAVLDRIELQQEREVVMHQTEEVHPHSIQIYEGQDGAMEEVWTGQEIIEEEVIHEDAADYM